MKIENSFSGALLTHTFLLGKDTVAHAYPPLSSPDSSTTKCRRIFPIGRNEYHFLENSLQGLVVGYEYCIVISASSGLSHSVLHLHLFGNYNRREGSRQREGLYQRTFSTRVSSSNHYFISVASVRIAPTKSKENPFLLPPGAEH